jgi:hypothetical protein
LVSLELFNLSGIDHISENIGVSGFQQASAGLSIGGSPSMDVSPFIPEETSPDEFLNCIKYWTVNRSDESFFFVLTNNVLGASYKDESLMLHDPETKNFRYIVSHQQETIFPSSKCPKILKKKIKILLKNQPDLERMASPSDNLLSTYDMAVKETNISTIYPVAWKQLKHLTIFRFSNMAIQGLFIDKTMLLINTNGKQKKVIYWDNQMYFYCFETMVLKESKVATSVSMETISHIQCKIKYIMKHLRNLK